MREKNWSTSALGYVQIIFFMALLAGKAPSQQAIFQWDGPEVNDSFGVRVSGITDLTGDGVPEIMVSGPEVDCATKDDGVVFVYSGGDGTTVQQYCGVVDQFGIDLRALGDVDGDGVADLLIGGSSYDSPSHGHWAGRACIYSGSTSSLLYQLEGEDQTNGFGVAAAGIGDIDGDGHADFVVCSNSYNWYSPIGIGRAYVYSGVNGSLIRIHQGEAEYDFFGENAANVGDVDADGCPDYAIMAPLHTTQGGAYVFSGRSGTPLYKWTGTGNNDALGHGLDGHLDWDGDGYGDVLVGSPHDLSSKGHVYIYSGRDGSTLADVKGRAGEFFGYGVANVGDMNRDGVPEILVTAPWNSQFNQYAGRASLLSGRTLRELYEFRGSPRYQYYYGTSSAGGLDYNGDAIPDLMVGTFGYNGATSGRVTLYAGNDLFLQPSDYDVTAGDTLTLSTRGGPAGALTLLVLTDVNGTSTFLPLVFSTLDSNDEASFTGTVPPGLAGITLSFQAFAQKATGGGGVIDSGEETISVY
jgi:hypothetical protein